jgi:hypothetical protein
VVEERAVIINFRTQDLLTPSVDGKLLGTAKHNEDSKHNVKKTVQPDRLWLRWLDPFVVKLFRDAKASAVSLERNSTNHGSKGMRRMNTQARYLTISRVMQPMIKAMQALTLPSKRAANKESRCAAIIFI